MYLLLGRSAKLIQIRCGMIDITLFGTLIENKKKNFWPPLRKTANLICSDLLSIYIILLILFFKYRKCNGNIFRLNNNNKKNRVIAFAIYTYVAKDKDCGHFENPKSMLNNDLKQNKSFLILFYSYSTRCVCGVGNVMICLTSSYLRFRYRRYQFHNVIRNTNNIRNRVGRNRTYNTFIYISAIQFIQVRVQGIPMVIAHNLLCICI